MPGMPDLVMESDQRGQGFSRMVWSREARALARPEPNETKVTEDADELKEIYGVGFGFRPNTKPELIITPHKNNTSSIVPHILVEVLDDGSLYLRIVDDANTTKFNSDDSFTVSFSSSISGVDFREDYVHSVSGGDMWSGAGASWGYNQSRLAFFPMMGMVLILSKFPCPLSIRVNNLYFYGFGLRSER